MVGLSARKQLLSDLGEEHCPYLPPSTSWIGGGGEGWRLPRDKASKCNQKASRLRCQYGRKLNGGSVMDLPALCNLEETAVLSLLAALGGRKISITGPSIMTGRSRSAGIDGRFYSAVSSTVDLVMDWVAICSSSSSSGGF